MTPELLFVAANIVLTLACLFGSMLFVVWLAYAEFGKLAGRFVLLAVCTVWGMWIASVIWWWVSRG